MSSNGDIFCITDPLWGIHWSLVNSFSQSPVMWSFDVFFDPCLNKQLGKPSRRRWLRMPSCSLWCHCNDVIHWEFIHPIHALFFLRKHKSFCISSHSSTLKVDHMQKRQERSHFTYSSLFDSMAGDDLEMLYTVQCCCNMVQFINILPTALPWQQQNVSQTSNTQQTPHTSPLQASYGVSMMSILK